MYTKASIVTLFAGLAAAQIHAPIGEPAGNPILTPLNEVCTFLTLRPVAQATKQDEHCANRLARSSPLARASPSHGSQPRPTPSLSSCSRAPRPTSSSSVLRSQRASPTAVASRGRPLQTSSSPTARPSATASRSSTTSRASTSTPRNSVCPRAPTATSCLRPAASLHRRRPLPLPPPPEATDTPLRLRRPASLPAPLPPSPPRSTSRLRLTPPPLPP
jgi:hypothetical protein